MKAERYPTIDWEHIRSVSILKTLEKYGYHPTKLTRKDAWFLSPLRSEKEASFKVSLNKNLWYDFGIGEGGSVIELVMALNDCSKLEAVKILQEETISSHLSTPTIHTQKEENEEKIKVVNVGSFKTAPLIRYIESRNIPLEIARSYCKEVWYSFNDNEYFAIGLENHLGGWELRNMFYKNSSSPKAYTIIKRESDQVVVTEGIFDFLSLAVLDPKLVETSDCVILNSISFIKDIQMILPSYSTVQLYLDNDSAGRKAANKLIYQHSGVIDKSEAYSDFTDLNDWLHHHITK